MITAEQFRNEILNKSFCEEHFKTKHSFQLSSTFNDTVFWYKQRLPNGDDVDVEISKVECDLSYKKSIMNLWVKHGYMKEALPNWWCVQTYHTLAKTIDDIYCKGSCWGDFNPTIVEGKCETNFKWILPASIKNKERLLTEIQKRIDKEMVKQGYPT